MEAIVGLDIRTTTLEPSDQLVHYFDDPRVHVIPIFTETTDQGKAPLEMGRVVSEMS